MDDGVPGEAGIVDEDVDLAVAELGSFLHQLPDALVLEQVSCHGHRLAAVGPDLGCYVLGFGSVNV
jgi:hypothetical protein